MTDFTALNKAAQDLIDAAVKPLTTQIATLQGQVAAGNTSNASLNATIANLKAQLAAATSLKEDTGLYWFKGDGNSWVYVYNALVGNKRHITSQEATLLRAIYGPEPAWPVATVPQAVADAIPLAK
jgi:hypothetical protein